LLSMGRSGGPLDEVTKMMKYLQLSQVEAQKRFDNELAFLRDVFNKVPPPATVDATTPYYPPRQYGNREYLPNQGAQMNRIRGCYCHWLMHRKEECQDLKQVIARGEIHQRDRFTYMGQQGVEDAILVPIPQELEGRIKWQKEWVQEHMLMKEGNLSHAQTMFFEDSKAGVSCNVGEEAEKINRVPVVYKASKELEVEVEQKTVRDRGDEGDNNQRTKQLFNPDRQPKILK